MDSKTNGNGITTREFVDEKIRALRELVDVRFTASETAVNAALQTSEKAISKAEASQAEINKTINELTKDVISLRESRSQSVGGDSARGKGRDQSNFNISLVVSTVLNVLMFLAMAWMAIKK